MTVGLRTRNYLTDFALANTLYAGATVTVFAVDPNTLIRSTSLAALYTDLTSGVQASNPQVLDGDGKWLQPIYVQQPVVMVVSGPLTAETGVIEATGAWAGPWAATTSYFAGDTIQDGPAGSGTLSIYTCVRPHTSGASFAVDLAAGRWSLYLDAAALARAFPPAQDCAWYGVIGDGVNRPLSSVAQVTIAGQVINTTGWTIDQWRTALPAATALSNGLDRVALQTALNAASGKGKVVVPTGLSLLLDKTINIPGDTYLEINGTLKIADQVNSHILLLAIGANNVVITGNGVLDGNKDHQTASNNAGYPNNGGNGGISTWLLPNPTMSNDNVHISGLTIQNVLQWPISLNGVTNGKVTGCLLKNSQSAPQFAFGSSNCIASGNTIQNIPDYAFACYEGCSSCVIDSNISTNCGPFGALNDGDATGAWTNVAQHNITISNNVSKDPTAYGIFAGSVVTNGTPNFLYDIQIFGNTIENARGSGMILAGVNDSIVEGNIIRGGRGDGSSTLFKSFWGYGARNLITGNVISSSGLGGPVGVTGTGIDVSSFQATVFSNNLFSDTGTTMTSAFSGTIGSHVVFLHNTVQRIPGVLFAAGMVLGADTIFFGQSVQSNQDFQLTGRLAVLGQSIELGESSSAGTTFIDLHSSGANGSGVIADYDCRVSSIGGTPGVAGQGVLTLAARTLDIQSSRLLSAWPTSAAGLASGVVWLDLADGNRLKVA